MQDTALQPEPALELRVVRISRECRELIQALLKLAFQLMVDRAPHAQQVFWNVIGWRQLLQQPAGHLRFIQQLAGGGFPVHAPSGELRRIQAG